jgi:hypothetical protein
VVVPSSALQTAAKTGNLPWVVERLTDVGGRHRLTYLEAWASVTQATAGGHLEVVKTLLTVLDDPSCVVKARRQLIVQDALRQAVANFQVEIAEYLVQKEGADVSVLVATGAYIPREIGRRLAKVTLAGISPAVP